MTQALPSDLRAIVVGGSAGAVAALKIILPALSSKVGPRPVVIVIHLPQDRPSAIAELFRRQDGLRVKEAEDKEPLVGGTVYFAPPGYHLLVETDRTLALSADDPVHFSRPSIDVLFESAAEVFGAELVGILLSGANHDGAFGLKTIREHGGTTIVQRPETAESSVMPQAAIDACTPSFVISTAEIAELLGTLP